MLVVSQPPCRGSESDRCGVLAFVAPDSDLGATLDRRRGDFVIRSVRNHLAESKAISRLGLDLG
jgi:hypothetical protein